MIMSIRLVALGCGAFACWRRQNERNSPFEFLLLLLASGFLRVTQKQYPFVSTFLLRKRKNNGMRCILCD
jgi:hypothetical protein